MDQVMAVLGQIISFIFTLVLVLIGSAIAGVGISIAFQKLLFKDRLKKYLKTSNKSFLYIKIPPSNEQKEQAMEDFLRALHRVLPNNAHISLEMVSSDQFLKFVIVTAKQYANLLQSQLYAQYPEAEIEEGHDYIDETNNTVFKELHFKRSSVNPLSTYHKVEEDLLKNLSALLSKTDPGDKVYIQIALKKVGSKFYERGYIATTHKMFGAKYAGENPTPSHWKMSQDLYVGKLRLGYTSSDKVSAQTKLSTLLGLFKSMKGGSNELKKKSFTLSRDTDQAFKARIFEKGDYWTCAELATLYHFPYKGAIVSNVVHTTSKRAPSPDILPRQGLADEEEVSFFGETNYRNDNKVFGIKRVDRRRHVYVVGKTGSGKSRLLQLLLISDIQNGQGCCLIDPHGDLAGELLMFVPRERIKDVIYVNPTDRDFPIGFNPLESVSDYQMRQHLSTFFIAIFKKLLAFNWNARMEHLMRYITLALLETPDSGVLGIQRILSDTTYRQRVIKQIQDPVVKSFWLNDFSASNQQFINEAVIPILNKVGQFTSNPIVRNMIGQRKNMLNFENFMNNGKIVIINLSKGKLGDENAALLGSMFITKIQQAALARSNNSILRSPTVRSRDGVIPASF